MSSRVGLLSQEDAKKAAEQQGLPEAFASLSVFQVLLKEPELAKEIAGTLTKLLFRDPKLDPRLRELIIMRIGWKTGSVYEWTQHWAVARGMDMSEEEILAVRDWASSTALSDSDKTILRATDETLDDGEISDETWSACANVLPSDGERIELVLVIAHWTFFSHLLKSLRIPLEEGTEPWPPDGKMPMS